MQSLSAETADMSLALLVLCLDHQEPGVMLWALEKSPQGG